MPKINRILLALIASLLIGLATAADPITDANWAAFGPSANPRSTAMVSYQGRLVVAGDFTAIDGQAISYLAQWNGTAWSAVGGGVDGRVLALAVDGSDLYAAGYFTHAGGVATAGIARWDGSAWTSLAASRDGSFNALAVVAGIVYVAGDSLVSVDGVAVQGIAARSGGSWSSLGGGATASWGGAGLVYTLTVQSGILYAGGNFASMGGVTCRNVAAWNGSAWAALGGGQSAPQLLATDGSGVYAASTPTVSRWDGTAWNVLGGSLPSYIQSMIHDGTGLVAQTSQGIWRHTGTAWTRLGAAHITSAGSAMTMYQGALIAEMPGSIARWNEPVGRWEPLTAPGRNERVFSLAAAPGSVLLGGYFATLGGIQVDGLASWDGSQVVAKGTPDLYSGAPCVARDGTRVAVFNGISSIHLLDGTWRRIAEVNGSVKAMAFLDGRLYAAGSFTSLTPVGSSTMSVNRIACWDGTTWTALGNGLDAAVFALLAKDGALLAGGDFTHAGGVAATGVARWDGTAWNALGAGSASTHSLADNGATIYSGTSNSCRAWNGSVWTVIASCAVNSMVVSGGTLYAGGDFTTIGGVPAANIAAWNGSAWSALGSGCNNKVNSLAVLGNTLVVAGDFTLAGGKSVGITNYGGLAVVDLDGNTATPGTPQDRDLRANTVRTGSPARAGTGIQLSAADADLVPVNWTLTNSAGGRFAIDGNGLVTTTAVLSTGAHASYSITATAGDGVHTGPAASFTIHVNTLPIVPSDADLAANRVSTTAATGTTVGITAAATDPDGGSITYALSDSAAGRFAIHATTGVVTVAGAIGSGGSYSIVVQASDGIEATAATFSIIAREPPSTPVDTSAAANSLVENTSIGTATGLVAHATDPLGATVSYALTDSAGGRFAINAATGVVTVAAALGSPTTRSVTVSASNGVTASSASFAIVITANQAPGALTDADVAADTVAASAPTGTTVGISARAIDPDGMPGITYSLGDSAGGRFAINAATGVVTVAASLGNPASRSIIVVASDGMASSQATFTIQVANQAPSAPSDIDGAANHVLPTAMVGAPVHITARSTDVDPGAALTYSLTDSAGGLFAIDAATGVVTVATALGAPASRTITVQASDGWAAASASFSIAVNDGVSGSSPGGGGGGGGGGGCGSGMIGILVLAAACLGLRRRR